MSSLEQLVKSAQEDFQAATDSAALETPKQNIWVRPDRLLRK